MRRLALGCLAVLAAVLLAGKWAEAKYESRGKRDPLIPLLTKEGQRIFPPGYDEEVPTGVRGLSLQGIVFDGRAESYAVINDRIVREGEQIEGMKVQKVGPDFVVISAEGVDHRIDLQKETDQPTSQQSKEENIAR